MSTITALSDSQRFQVSEARALLTAWDAERGLGGLNYGTERTLADLARNLLAIIDSLDADTGEEASSLPRHQNRRWVEPGTVDPEPLTGVPMVCAKCRKPVQRSDNWAGWAHLSVDDGLDCSAVNWGPVRAMVAEGNEAE